MKQFMGLVLLAAMLFASGVHAQMHPEDTIVGIGATLEKLNDGSIQVDALIAGAPAEHSGLAVGDIVYAVRSTPTSEVVDVQSLQLNDVVALIRGTIGVPVEVTYLRGGAAPVTLSIVRGQFVVNDDEQE